MEYIRVTRGIEESLLYVYIASKNHTPYKAYDCVEYIVEI